MGFMDKAKKLAEQAQQKLDETQKQFNERQSGQAAGQAEGTAVKYDEHGRPIEDAPPAGAAPPPSAEPAEPASPAGTAPPTAEPTPPPPTAPTEEPPAPAEKPAPSGDSPDANPDPFKPIQ
jgi:hypothetical protein